MWPATFKVRTTLLLPPRMVSQALVKYVEEKGCKNGYVMWPIRTAVSGKQMTPAGATEIMEVLGKEESLNRIRKGIELLKANV